MIERFEKNISNGEIISSAAYGLLNSPIVQADRFFNHQVWINFETISPGASTLDIYIKAISPAVHEKIVNIPPAISVLVKTIDFSSTPYDTIFSFGGNSGTVLGGCVFYDYQFICYNNTGASVEIKSVWLTMSNIVSNA